MASTPISQQQPTFCKRLAVGAQAVRPILYACNDEQILEELRAHGLNVDCNSLREWCFKAGSAEEVTLGLIGPTRTPNLNNGSLAWIWTAIRVLWERWFPESPSFEMLDDRIAAGYDNVETPQGAEEWLAGYEILKKLGDKLQMRTLREFDRRFAGTELLQNWVQDLEMALGDLARPTSHQDWLQRRIAFCEDFLTCYPSDDEPIVQNMRRALAESLWHVGQAQRADDLFKKWLAESPRWSWGWIGWADCYQFGPEDRRDLNRAEQILQQGLGVERIEDRDVFYERLEDIYKKQGQTDKLAQLRALAGPKPGAAPVPALRQAPKIGRNDPCPCGSGKKYKKCCGR